MSTNSTARSSLRDFDILQQLGSGSFGKVYRVHRHRDGREYCLKSIGLEALNEQERCAAVNECRLLAALDSPHVVRYYDSFLSQSPPALNIVMEYCAHGDLGNYLKNHTGPLDELVIWKIAIQITIGIAELHRKRILHRDIKTLNIFMDANDNIKIGDLGVSRLLETESFAQTLVGTPYYISPELVNDQPYGRPSDIWALGVILYELCARRRPFTAATQSDLLMKILKVRPAPLPETYSDGLRQLVAMCLEREPENRPSAVQILQFNRVRSKARQCGVVLPAWVVEEDARTPVEDPQSAEVNRLLQKIVKLKKLYAQFAQMAAKLVPQPAKLAALQSWLTAHPKATDEELTRRATEIVPVAQIEIVSVIRDMQRTLSQIEVAKAKVQKLTGTTE